MKKIDISTQTYPNTFTLVDDDMYEEVNKFKWCVFLCNHKRYAGRIVKKKAILLHRYIMNTPVDKDTDHRDGNTLDNQRSNLRICTSGQNAMNKRKQRNNKSGFKGVSWYEPNKKWRSSIGINGKVKHLGYYTCKIRAAKAYDIAANNLFRKFAKINFPE